VHCIAAK